MLTGSRTVENIPTSILSFAKFNNSIPQAIAANQCQDFLLGPRLIYPWAHFTPHFVDDPRIVTNESFGLSGAIESSKEQFFTDSSQVSIFLQIHPEIIGKKPAGLYPARRTMLKKDD
jgi:hypothetical protein